MRKGTMATALREDPDQGRILLLGAGGMLGEAAYKAVSARYPQVLATDIAVNEPWLSYLDVRDIGALEKVFESFSPTVVFNLAALTDLEYCEQNPGDAWATNALGAENVALLAERHGSTLVYVSTAGIFDGEQDVFTDFDIPNPKSYYAKSKYHGELFVERRVSKYFVFRAGWMMGGGVRKDKKFINKIYKQIKNGAKQLHVVADKQGTPTYTVDFANSMVKVLASGYFGLYNQVGGGGGSRLDVAREFVRLLDLEKSIEVVEVDSSHFKVEYFAPRPFSEKLVNLKLDLRNMNYMRDWKEALAEYSGEFTKDLHCDDADRR
jgi:dTDP-4-dehydrorhamnose reductase